MKSPYLLTALLSLLFSHSLKAQPPDGATENFVTLYYAYDNPCELCHEDQEFYASFIEQANDVPEMPLVFFESFNLFRVEDKEYFARICGELGIEREALPLPILIIGDEYLAGDEVYGGAWDLYLRQKDRAVKTRVTPFHSTAQSPVQKAAIPRWDFPKAEEGDSVLVCFVTTGCESCEKAREFFAALPGEVPLNSGGLTRIKIYYFNVSEGEGLPMARHFFDAYQVPQGRQLVPIVFYSTGYLSGLENIEKNLQEVLALGQAEGFVFPGSGEERTLAWREFPALFLAGLLGGLNPCSVSMLLFLLSLLAAKSGRILPLGLSYVAARMITYLALGLGLFSLGQALNGGAFVSLTGIVRIVVFALSLVLAALNLGDFFNARKENYGAIRVQLPAALRRFNHRLIKGVTEMDTRFLAAAIFLLGAAVSAGEFLCTGQIYLAAILYLIRMVPEGRFMGFAGLLCYTLAASLPPLVFLIFCYKGKQALALSEFFRQKMPLIKLANAALFSAFALLAFFAF